MSERRPERVAVVGAGAIGCYLLSLVAAAGGADVTLCVRTPLHEVVYERDGRTQRVRVTVATDPAAIPPVDWVVLAVKAQDTEGTRPWLDALAGERTRVVVAQNGVDHVERVAPLAPRSEILPLLVYCTIEPLSRGHIRHTLGNRLVVPASAGGHAFAALLDGSGVEIEYTDDLPTAAWRKLLANVYANPVTALTLRRAEIFREAEVQRLGRALLEEAVAVGIAEGARLDGGDVDATLAALGQAPPGSGTSMLFDRVAGRPLEHDALTGLVVRAGRRHGIATPANDVIQVLLGSLKRP